MQLGTHCEFRAFETANPFLSREKKEDKGNKEVGVRTDVGKSDAKKKPLYPLRPQT
jgi:hypothetical protein